MKIEIFNYLLGRGYNLVYYTIIMLCIKYIYIYIYIYINIV